MLQRLCTYPLISPSTLGNLDTEEVQFPEANFSRIRLNPFLTPGWSANDWSHVSHARPENSLRVPSAYVRYLGIPEGVAHLYPGDAQGRDPLTHGPSGILATGRGNHSVHHYTPQQESSTHAPAWELLTGLNPSVETELVAAYDPSDGHLDSAHRSHAAWFMEDGKRLPSPHAVTDSSFNLISESIRICILSVICSFVQHDGRTRKSSSDILRAAV